MNYYKYSTILSKDRRSFYYKGFKPLKTDLFFYYSAIRYR